MFGTATCRGNPEELVSWGNQGKLVNWWNPGKLVRRRKHCYKTRTDDGLQIIRMCVKFQLVGETNGGTRQTGGTQENW